PLPDNPAPTENVLATESKGLSKSQPTVQEKEPEAIPIPDKNTKTKVKPAPQSATQRKAQPEPPESNQIPYGEGGPGSGGDFGTRYAWYVRMIQQKVQENWLKYEVDPRITEAHRVFLIFDVMRD